MARNSEAYRILQTADHLELVAFCAACAERGSGIHRVLGAPEATALLDEALSLGWHAATGETDEDAIAGLLEEVEELLAPEEDEDDEDDTEGPEFYATQSLMLAVNTLSVAMNRDLKRAELSGHTMETLLNSFDFILRGERAVITGAGEPSPTGDLQRLEQEEQLRFLSSYVDGTGRLLSGTTAEELRDSCSAAREQIAQAVESVAERKGWEVSPE
ncbi:hypothetical protein CUT44_08255 [Streptomyces carminius]|uniref:Uncharacterized protein n=1 Tax=Streptomyces carminius TaxID=2665496 RepID=A0A2M8M229_9ACTN|nr:hypothetical protein [Streptomyces carminius]PJE98251.1 hypothetical protein CUT44_08255 [Streptomyces carminius]